MLVHALDSRRSLCSHHGPNSHRRLYGTQTHTSRRPLFSSALASAGEGSHPKPMSNEVFALSTARNNFSRNLVAMIHVLAVPRADSRTAACSRDSFDGSDRDYFFPRMIVCFATLASNRDGANREAFWNPSSCSLKLWRSER